MADKRDTYFTVDVLDGKAFVPVTVDDSGVVAKFKTRYAADVLARSLSDGPEGRPAKVVLVKTIRSVLVAYEPKVKP